MPQRHFLLRRLLLPNQIGRLVSHIQVIIEVFVSYVDMDKFLTLLHT